jgi:ABC-type sugar transport system ATPase subunit
VCSSDLIELRAELRRLQRERGYTFVMATPDFSEALAVADTVVMLRAGKVIQICDPQTLYESPADRETARFVGSPEINLLAASLHDTDDDGRVLRVAGAALPTPDCLLALKGRGIASFELGVRPENLRLADAAGAAAVGELIDIEPLGLRSVLTARNNTAQIRLLVPARQAAGLSMGQNIGINFGAAPWLVFDPASGQRLN